MHILQDLSSTFEQRSMKHHPSNACIIRRCGRKSLPNFERKERERANNVVESSIGESTLGFEKTRGMSIKIGHKENRLIGVYPNLYEFNTSYHIILQKE